LRVSLSTLAQLKKLKNRFLAPIVTALLLLPAFITIPRQPFVLDDALSEKAALNYANEHKLQFGSELVFTYGPLGFLTSRYYFDHAANLRMATDILLGFAIAAGVCLVAWQLETVWRCLLLGVFLFVSANIDPRADLLLYIGLLCWGMLCLVESGAMRGLCTACFTVLVAFGMLVKISFLVIGGGSLIAVAADLMLRGHRRISLGMFVGFVATFVLGWVAAGQAIPNLTDFFSNGWAIIRGYDQAVGLDGLSPLKWRGVLVAVLVIGAVIPRALYALEDEEKNANWRRAAFACWLTGFTFLVWKHGFVRADLYHMGFFFGLAPVLVLVLELVHKPCVAGWISRGFGLIACLVTLLALQSFYFASWQSSLIQPFRSWAYGIRDLCLPAEYRHEMEHSLRAAREKAQLPRLKNFIGSDTVDVFGQDQAYAIFNNLNYHPRPVFQSYMAYNARLMHLNEEFFLSKDAPKYVLFNLSSIDHKLPPLEDAMALRALLLRYSPVDAEGQFLLLKSTSHFNSLPPPVPTFLRQGIIRPGEPINLRDAGLAKIWLEIEVEPTLLGRVRHILYKPPKIYLAAWRGPARNALSRYLAPAPMLSAGFVASPLLLNRKDVQDIYDNKPVTRPSAYSIEFPPGTERYWQDAIHFRLYKIQNPP
jgi:hypothetical protein